jgi:hypothetical protein
MAPEMRSRVTDFRHQPGQLARREILPELRRQAVDFSPRKMAGLVLFPRMLLVAAASIGHR